MRSHWGSIISALAGGDSTYQSEAARALAHLRGGVAFSGGEI